ncbi:hypothetical protein niasHT_003179 [Heterodera trifolii]|uniref:G-protein coupled receptors family 1 profile domain-containing protein n=1 Tax=Heterodera trifolii TaxID=157864 RepID=A0ABD2MB84_9BILA
MTQILLDSNDYAQHNAVIDQPPLMFDAWETTMHSTTPTTSFSRSTSSPTAVIFEQQRPNSAAHSHSLLQYIQNWLNTLDNFSQLQEMLSWLLNGPLSLLFVLSGIVLNALCVVVFVRFRRNVSGGTTPIIHYYLISLAGWHSALLFNAFLLYCLPTMLWGSVVSSGPYVHLYPPTYALANATHTGTVWIILALTLDRYLALCMPFKHRIFSKRSRVKRLVVGLSIGALFFCLPRFFEVQTTVECYALDGGAAALLSGAHATVTETAGTEALPVANATVTYEEQQRQVPQQMNTVYGSAITKCDTFVQRTGLPENQLYRTIYHILLGSAFVTILPGVLTFVLTLRISIALGEARHRRKRLSHCCAHLHSVDGTGAGSTTARTTTTTISCNTERESLADNSVGEKQHHRIMSMSGAMTNGGKKPSLKRKEHRANVMLVVIIVKFLISDILPTVLDVFETFIGNEVFMASPLATLWVDFSNFLLVINCSTNFWVFLLYVRGFRQRCVRLITNSFQCSTQSLLHDEVGGSCIASLRPSTPRISANGMQFAGGVHQNRQHGSGSEYSGECAAQQNYANFAMPNFNGKYRKEQTMDEAAVFRPKRASSLAISVQQRNNLTENGTTAIGGAVPRPSSITGVVRTVPLVVTSISAPLPPPKQRPMAANEEEQRHYRKKRSLAAW